MARGQRHTTIVLSTQVFLQGLDFLHLLIVLLSFFGRGRREVASILYLLTDWQTTHMKSEPLLPFKRIKLTSKLFKCKFYEPARVKKVRLQQDNFRGKQVYVLGKIYIFFYITQLIMMQDMCSSYCACPKWQHRKTY